MRENLKQYAILTKSASDISKELARKYDTNVVPIYIYYYSKKFREGIDINSNKICRLHKEKKAIFTSSSPSPK